MTPELYKYWYEGGKLEYRHKPSGLWHTLETRTETSSLMICNVFEFRKKKNPHKHAEFIKAWADGAAIEVCAAGRWTEVPNPVWKEDLQYRIKKE